MILFAPAYDDATRATHHIALRYRARARAALLAEEATRERLIGAVRAAGPGAAVVAFSHGTADVLRAQHSRVALDADDVEEIPRGRVLAYACHTAAGLGGEMAAGGVGWWGYAGAVVAPPLDRKLDHVFGPVFDRLVSVFVNGPAEQVDEWLRPFRDACDQAAESLDELGDFESPLEAYTCLHHLWDRLPVWLPLRGEPVHHPESTGSHITG